MESRSLGILLPSAYRPHALIQCLVSLLTENQPTTIVVSLVEDDEASPLVLRDLPVEIITRSEAEYRQGAVYAWNQCLRQAPDCELYVLAADDLIFRRHWLNWALLELDRLGGSGLVGFNDLSSDGMRYAAHWLADRKFLIEHNGGVMYPPMYKSWWADREVSEIAQVCGCYAWARSAIVEHFNYTFGKSVFDRTYREAALNYEADRALYQARKAQGFPRTWEPILSPN